ncbi:lysophospholipid acyltransferase family protein [Streptomyces parvulus]|uniref:Acyltransferase n=1 Tax=Streptomyces parvulus TaxID=146923 RepID=A0A191VAI6_9ACTN|nr:lysophospholipid acyltransferase family protein [Streptomyces parvulus]ANJ12041.1 acyltransferase [Streptomyces parvulus]MZD59241.1 1-acyl-sn-glycerol-3-phosphate acyltransferase [Streptomyces sp. SID5606]
MPVPGRTHNPYGFWYRLAAGLVRPVLFLLVERRWRGHEHMPAEGGFLTVANHISPFDPLTFGHFQYSSGRPPRMLAKASLFDVPFVGAMLRRTGQIPVHRGTADAVSALRSAVDAVRAGECVAIYPEGTITRDPGMWPMAGKTGAARIALTTGAPVIPVAQWGAQRIVRPYARGGRGDRRVWLAPRQTVHVVAGAPVDLSRYAGLPLTPDVLRGATEDIMAAVTALLAGIRREEPPTRRHTHARPARETA